jgi:tetratricopeptide (TPR) repeat protein
MLIEQVSTFGRIRTKYSILLLLFLLSAFPFASASGQRGHDKKGTAVVTSRFEELQAKGSEALFNLDYDLARQKFKEISRLDPDDPTGPEMLATTLWLETLNQARRLQAAIYSTQSFYAGTKDKPDPRVVQDFRDLTRQATQLARARLQRNPKDPQALYMLGATESLKASFAATVERRFIAALRSGSSGVETQRDVLKLDPSLRDAELTIGMYDYIVGTLPLPVRMLASIAGERGSKKRGIQTLERVAKEGQWSRDEAKVLLIAIYKKEKRYPEALALSRELQEKYPRNYLFRMETADTLVAQAAIARQTGKTREADAMEGEALSTFETMLHERPAAGTAPRALDLIHFRYGEAFLLMGQPQSAAGEFLAATIVKGADAGTVTRAHLRAAQAFDLTGKRNEALAEYRVVLSRPNVYDSYNQARRGQKEPYKEQTRSSPKQRE